MGRPVRYRKGPSRDTFHLADGKDVTCDFMNMTNSSQGFSKGDGFTPVRP